MEENNNQAKGCLGIAGGCLIKILGFILLMILMAGVKTCSRGMMRNRLQYGETQSIEGSKENIDRQLYKTMDELRAELPKKMDEMITQKDVNMDERYFYYISDMNDADYPLSSADMISVKQSHTQVLHTNMPHMKLLIEYLVKTGRGLVYHYDGTSSGASRDVIYSTKELSQLINE